MHDVEALLEEPGRAAGGGRPGQQQGLAGGRMTLRASCGLCALGCALLPQIATAADLGNAEQACWWLWGSDLVEKALAAHKSDDNQQP
jgi:hypothetical protein